MSLGTFSMSLAVKDIQKSKQFYLDLGFNIIGGDETQNWLILKNGETTLGLFSGMFNNNMLTFNPGWDKNCKKLKSFPDIRELVAQYKEAGIEVSDESFASESGPGSFTVKDPDGNIILFDQHV